MPIVRLRAELSVPTSETYRHCSVARNASTWVPSRRWHGAGTDGTRTLESCFTELPRKEKLERLSKTSITDGLPSRSGCEGNGRALIIAGAHVDAYNQSSLAHRSPEFLCALVQDWTLC
ncbi:unnamed protein product [Cylicocyclus nassatus]|uniref:Uncharacterized protein n=1 Tax=Cylicocyclus nassatus TaxID=53992 RepID=A0AA36GUG0_CYLNA|nr:unnamed protein product [Cylicocyclus nassatus]